MKFTALAINQIKPQEKRYLVYETGGKGFALRVAPSGTVTYLFVYRFEKKLKYFTIGKASEISLKEARKRLKDAKQQLECGVDPSLAKQLKALENLEDPTIHKLTNEYLEKWAKPRKRSWQEDERLIQKEILPKWGKRKASSIKRREIILLLEEIAARGAPIVANRTFALVRRIYNFAIERDILDQTPCLRVKPISQEAQRDRVLNHEELHEFWQKLPQSKMSDEVQILLKIMLATAQRKGEIVSAQWVHFDFNQRWWTIPAAQAKNGKSHRVYLSDMTIGLLKQLKELNPTSEYLFPSPTRNTHMTPDCISRAIHRSREIFGLKQFSAHDLRRTAASHMTAIGIPRLVVSKILNHVEKSVTAVYDRHSYDNEKQQALILWTAQLKKIILNETSSNVVKLQLANA